MQARPGSERATTPAPAAVALALALAPLGLAFLLCVLFVNIANHGSLLFFGFDGNTWRVAFDVQQQFRTPFSASAFDPLQGMFDAAMPAYREYFLPYALSLAAGVATPGDAFVYCVYALVIFAATFALGRVVGMDVWASAVGAFLVPLATLPAFARPLLYPITELDPHLEQTSALTVLMVVCFWAMGGRRRWQVAGLAMAAAACLMLAILSAVSVVMLMVPAVAAYGCASLFDEASWRARLPKISAALFVLAVPLGLGAVAYMLALTRYSAAFQFQHEFLQDRSSEFFASIIWHGGDLGPEIIAAGVAGALYARMRGAGRLARFAGAHLLTTLAFQGVASAVVLLAAGYKGPSPLYFEMLLVPFSLLFAGYLLVSVGQAACVLVSGRSRDWVGMMVAAGVGGAALLAGWADLSGTPPDGGFTPATPDAFVTRLADTVAVQPGRPFNGSVATFTGNKPKKATWVEENQADYGNWQKYGNDFRSVGLWAYRIPTLFQYSNFISPFYHRVITTLLSRPGDQRVRSILVLSRPREAILKAFGVRLLIVDQDPGFGRVILDRAGAGGPPLHLVELEGYNRGDFSPTRITLAGTAAQALERLAQPDFDASREVILDTPPEGPEGPEGPLMPALRSRLTVLKDGLGLAAESAGRSLLVLPVQYSRCWRIEGAPTARLVRANLVQLGVLFEGRLDATLALRLAPFGQAGCRMEDLRDMERLDLK